MMAKMQVYKKVPKSKCYQMTGKAPIGVRWIDVNKQDTTNPVYRSRLLGKEFKTSDDMSLYGSPPPIEALQLIVPNVFMEASSLASVEFHKISLENKINATQKQCNKSNAKQKQRKTKAM